MSNYIIYAYIIDEEIKQMGVFTDALSAYTDANITAKAILGKNAFAVDATNYNVGIGDFYRNGEFMVKNSKTNEFNTVEPSADIQTQLNNLVSRISIIEDKLNITEE